MTPENIQFIAVHCSATPRSMDIGVEEIRRWHKRKGWSDIGYHYVIRKGGEVEIGRPLDKAGAHVKGYNHKSWGICLEGGVDNDDNPVDNFDGEQIISLEGLINQLLIKAPKAKVKGHKDFPDVNKACPCFDVIPWFYEGTP